MNCSVCNALLPAEAARCPSCGTEVPLDEQATVTNITPAARRPASDSSRKRNPISYSSAAAIGYLQTEKSSASTIANGAVFLMLFVVIVVVGTLLARCNLQLGRGDRAGAFRVALCIFLMTWVSVCLFADHVPTFYELLMFFMITAWALIAASLVWLVYIAPEPHFRRRWPNSLISWTRLLAGQVRDAVVGRDLLLGTAAGVFWVICDRAEELAPQWTGKTPSPPAMGDLIRLGGGIRFVGDEREAGLGSDQEVQGA